MNIFSKAKRLFSDGDLVHYQDKVTLYISTGYAEVAFENGVYVFNYAWLRYFNVNSVLATLAVLLHHLRNNIVISETADELRQKAQETSGAEKIYYFVLAELAEGRVAYVTRQELFALGDWLAKKEVYHD